MAGWSIVTREFVSVVALCLKSLENKLMAHRKEWHKNWNISDAKLLCSTYTD